MLNHAGTAIEETITFGPRLRAFGGSWSPSLMFDDRLNMVAADQSGKAGQITRPMQCETAWNHSILNTV